MYSLTWLPDVLRKAGLTVKEAPGWQNRGHGDMGTVQGVLCHHTACHRGTADMPSEHVVTEGRPDLQGPLCHLLLGRQGDYEVIAAGKAWHAGAGHWQSVTEGNTHLVGIEAENAGDGEPWPAAQLDAYQRGCAAILKHVGANASMCVGHKEWCIPKGRKIDPLGIDMVAFRNRVAELMK